MIDLCHGWDMLHTVFYLQFRQTRPPDHQGCSHSIELHHSPGQAKGQDAVGPDPLHLPDLLPSPQLEAKEKTTGKTAKRLINILLMLLQQ